MKRYGFALLALFALVGMANAQCGVAGGGFSYSTGGGFGNGTGCPNAAFSAPTYAAPAPVFAAPPTVYFAPAFTAPTTYSYNAFAFRGNNAFRYNTTNFNNGFRGGFGAAGGGGGGRNFQFGLINRSDGGGGGGRNVQIGLFNRNG